MKQFLYLDTDIINSIIAQTEKGLVQITCDGMITNIIGEDTFDFISYRKSNLIVII